MTITQIDIPNRSVAVKKVVQYISIHVVQLVKVDTFVSQYKSLGNI